MRVTDVMRCGTDQQVDMVVETLTSYRASNTAKTGLSSGDYDARVSSQTKGLQYQGRAAWIAVARLLPSTCSTAVNTDLSDVAPPILAKEVDALDNRR